MEISAASCLAPAGRKNPPLSWGTFTLQERGDDFYSPRFQEGARYWIRIHKQYLFHSVPRDEDGNIIKAEEDKIGAPASHGCIRLADKDAELVASVWSQTGRW
ncbi:MAG: L,D-transpeptidase [Clostridia bacterium]